MSDRTRPDAAAVRRIKTLVAERFDLADATTLAVSELRCHEPDCPPIETVITARAEDGSIRDWRVAKPVRDIEPGNIERLGRKQSAPRDRRSRSAKTGRDRREPGVP